MRKTLIISQLWLLFSFNLFAQNIIVEDTNQPYSVPLHFELAVNDIPFDVGNISIWDSGICIVHAIQNHSSYVSIQVPLSIYKRPNAILKIEHRLYKNKDLEFKLSSVAFGVNFDTNGNPYAARGCGMQYYINVLKPMYGLYGGRIITSEEIEHMAH